MLRTRLTGNFRARDASNLGELGGGFLDKASEGQYNRGFAMHQ